MGFPNLIIQSASTSQANTQLIFTLIEVIPLEAKVEWILI